MSLLSVFSMPLNAIKGYFCSLSRPVTIDISHEDFHAFAQSVVDLSEANQRSSVKLNAGQMIKSFLENNQSQESMILPARIKSVYDLFTVISTTEESIRSGTSVSKDDWDMVVKDFQDLAQLNLNTITASRRPVYMGHLYPLAR